MFLLSSMAHLSIVFSTMFDLATLVFANSALNPLLFCWRLHELRTAVKNLLMKATCHQRVEN